MNAADILMYGHRTVLDTLAAVPETACTTPGVCGAWSVKDIIAHLASFEQVLKDVLGQLVDGRATPSLERMHELGAAFNDVEVAQRAAQSFTDVVREYNAAYEHVAVLVRQIALDRLRRPGTLPWYGAEYAVDDLIVYMYYGHKREHSAQIALFRDHVLLAS